MKGHKKGLCRPSPWVDHGDNNKQHGGHYEWETKRWSGSKWEPVVVTAVAENQVVVAGERAKLAVPKNSVIAQADE